MVLGLGHGQLGHRLLSLGGYRLVASVGPGFWVLGLGFQRGRRVLGFRV